MFLLSTIIGNRWSCHRHSLATDVPATSHSLATDLPATGHSLATNVPAIGHSLATDFSPKIFTT
jgi:hypothetical protein